IDEFRAQYWATQGALLPELTANGQAGRNQQVFGTFGSFTYDSYRATADLSWELDLWGRLRRSTSAARSDLVARQEDRRALQLSLIGDVATAFFYLRAADLNLAISRRTPDAPRRHRADRVGACGMAAYLPDHRSVRHPKHRILQVVRVRHQHLAGVCRSLDPAVQPGPAGGGRADQHRPGAGVAGAVAL